MRNRPNPAHFACIQVPAVVVMREFTHRSAQASWALTDANRGKDTNDAKERTHWIKVTTSPAAAEHISYTFGAGSCSHAQHVLLTFGYLNFTTGICHWILSGVIEINGTDPSFLHLACFCPHPLVLCLFFFFFPFFFFMLPFFHWPSFLLLLLFPFSRGNNGNCAAERTVKIAGRTEKTGPPLL